MLKSFACDIAFRGLSTSPFAGTPTCALGRRSVIYGRNGAGKTTFSEALRLAAAGGLADSSEVTAQVFADGEVRSVIVAPGSTPFNVFVYNRYYVQESLRLFLDGEGQSLPILKLGAENVQSEEEIQRANEYLKKLDVRKQAVLSAMQRIRNDRDTLEKETKAEIIAALAPADAAYYNPTRFQVTLVRRLLMDHEAKTLDDITLESEIAAATAQDRQVLEIPSELENIDANLHRRINDEMMGVQIQSIQIPRLASNRTLSDWVEAGQALHRPNDTCSFCQAGIVTSAVLDQYRLHFSAALDALRTQITKQVELLQEKQLEIDSWLDSLPSPDQFLPDFRDGAKSALDTLSESAVAVSSSIARAIAGLQARLADPLKPRPDEDRLETPFPRVDADAFLKVIFDNNAAIESQEQRISTARTNVESHYGAAMGGSYRLLLSRIQKAGRANSTLESRIRAVDQEILRIRQSQDDVGRMANLIDCDLREHFGHAHLSVSVSVDGKGYVVHRAGTTANRLSEGERNALAYAYFLRSLEADGVDPAQTVVVIDDPVTSLDKESLFAAFALGTTRTVDYAQVIVLTHDYEYFRLQLGELSSRWHTSQKRILEGDGLESLFPAVTFLELRAVRTTGVHTRHGELRAIPKSLIQHRSEYHFLFHHVAEAVQGNSDAYLPMLGNAGRRLLEGFLSFRAPSKINFQDKVDAVSIAAGIDGSLRKRVVKFLHSQSHREEPRPSAALDFPSIESELHAALVFIQKADSSHFSDMCVAVGLNPSDLLANLDLQPAG